MTASDTTGKHEHTRHLYGPRPVAALVPALVRPAFRRRAPGTAQIFADWALIVGPAIAAVTVPRKLFSGTLSIGCSGPMALELQHLSDQLIGRITAHMGQSLVTRLRFVQDAPLPVAAPRRPVVPPMDVALPGIADAPLRAALERLGRAVLTRPPE